MDVSETQGAAGSEPQPRFRTQPHSRHRPRRRSEPHPHPQPVTVTPEGAAWLASSSDCPRIVRTLWAARPSAPSVLPCGRAFDAVSMSTLFGRHVLQQLWRNGPGSGPVAVHRGRVLLLAEPGTAHRLPTLTAWEQCSPAVPPVLCHGPGDAITVPPLSPLPTRTPPPSRWLIAPSARHPWLPSADTLLWACLRAARTARTGISAEADFVGAQAGC
jgi:hypothetical protein